MWAVVELGTWVVEAGSFTGLSGLGIWLAVVAAVVGSRITRAVHSATTSLVLIHAQLVGMRETAATGSSARAVWGDDPLEEDPFA